MVLPARPRLRLLPWLLALWRDACASSAHTPQEEYFYQLGTQRGFKMPGALQPQQLQAPVEQLPSQAELEPLLGLFKKAFAPRSANRKAGGGSAGRPQPGASASGRPSPLLQEFEKTDFGPAFKTDIGFPTVDGSYPWPTDLQKRLMAAGALYDGGGKFPVDLYKCAEPGSSQLHLSCCAPTRLPRPSRRYYPTYHKCDECALKPVEQLLKEGLNDADVSCFVCPVIFCVPCKHVKSNAHVVNYKPFNYCAQTLENPHFPKACAGSGAEPIGGRFKCDPATTRATRSAPAFPSPCFFCLCLGLSPLLRCAWRRCVDDKGYPLPPEDCNPLWQMIGNDWNSQGINLPYLANFIKIISILFGAGTRPPMEPDYFDVKSAYKGAVLEPYPFLTPGTTPNQLAPPL